MITTRKTTRMRALATVAAAAALLAGPSIVGLTAASAAPVGPPTCDTRRILGAISAGERGVELAPSLLGLAPGTHAASVTEDISEAFGYPANSGAIVATVTNAYAHPTADDLVSGNNIVTTQGGTEVPQPTKIEFSGTVPVIVHFTPDSQWFQNDRKTLNALDGTKFTFASTVVPIPAGFTTNSVHYQAQANHWMESPPLASGAIYSYFTNYLSEVAFDGAGNPTGFASTTNAFDFQATQSNFGEFPTAFVFAWAACPTGADDVRTTDINTPITINVLGNDPTPGMTIAPEDEGGFTQPANGVAMLNSDGTFLYTPNPGWSGTDTFTYTAYDSVTQQSVTQTVTITVPPRGVDDFDTTPMNTPVDIPVLANDPAKNLTVTEVSTPSNGTATINEDGTVTYLPNEGWTGTDTFTYIAVNESGQSVEQTVTVTVTPVGKDDSATTPTNTPVQIPVLSNDPTKNLTIESTTQPSNGTVKVNPDGTVTYTPKDGFSGIDTFTYIATDASGQPVVQTVTVTVTPVGKDDSATTQPGTPVRIPVLDNDPTKGLTITSVTNPGNGTVTINSDGTLTYTPNKGFSGTETFTYTAVDAAGQRVTQIVTVTVPGASATGTTATPTPERLPDTGAGGVDTLLTGGLAALGFGAIALMIRRRRNQLG